ncbi:hepatitis A virus cellular receptor 2 isoform X2 [Pipistrellus kuhlii]|uniref:Hepatitis A virus cellular receptor 2 n=1 Tax=Pipistrellus kuhlii TaxID=59472 RepID=A0A7J7XAA5_PIPKU|nr:hepatitis A virus cellular receptor 2 isoform X2 [Pipistrellus kuhlii]KAF6346647.1 hepatitis A virus cellular receptor 2 [Pipistrellus kuhlii]
MFSHLSFDCVLWLLLLTRSLEESFTATVGQNAYLSCHYFPTTSENLVPVCWGRGSCPTFQCQNTVLTTNGRELNYQSSSRYQLKGNIHKGDVSLTIENVTLADSGTYCCRIQFLGPMNDKKSNLNLDIKPAETQTLETFHDKNQTQISTLADELQDSGYKTTRISVYIAAGITAGLSLVLIFGALILKWYSHRKEKLQNSSLITLANRLPSSGLENTVAEGIHSRENVYTIEENPYELEDPSTDYCYVISG